MPISTMRAQVSNGTATRARDPTLVEVNAQVAIARERVGLDGLFVEGVEGASGFCQLLPGHLPVEALRRGPVVGGHGGGSGGVGGELWQ